jgi:hypothetical protein
MTDFMKHDTSTDEPGPFANTPFEEYDQIRTWNDKERLVNHATNALRHLKQHKTATDKDLRNAAIAGNDHQLLKEGLWAKVAPLLATAENVEWADSFSLEADAPEHNSDEWKQAASELEIPDTRSHDLVPKSVGASYRHLEKLTQRNGYPRPAHQFELERNCGVHMTDRGYRKVWQYLEELPGVDAPADTPAWEYVDTTEATSEEPAEGEVHG